MKYESCILVGFLVGFPCRFPLWIPSVQFFFSRREFLRKKGVVPLFFFLFSDFLVVGFADFC